MALYAPEIIFFALWLGWWLDRRFGEVPFWHPLVGYGCLVGWLEKALNADRQTGSAQLPVARKRLLGLIALIIAVLPFTLGLMLLLPEAESGSGYLLLLHLLLQGGVLYFALGAKSLDQHLAQIEQPLLEGDLPKARFYVGWIVSRDTSDMDQMRVTRAAIESGLENGSDSAFAAVFWFLLAGAPGVLLYRLANTLDAMWGYKTERLLSFGWAAARFDDLLNLLPARISALLYALNSPHGFQGMKTALHCWRKQSHQWESPNAGPVMAAGAGALGVQLGGGDTYHGQWKERPLLGAGKEPQAGDLRAARRLVQRVLFSWLLLGSVSVWVVYLCSGQGWIL